MKKCLKELNVDDYAFFDCYDALANIFVDNNLALAEANVEFFLNADGVTEILDNARTCFDNATTSINNIIKLYSENQYLRYARLYCKSKCNQIRYTLIQNVDYYVNDLAAEALSIPEDFPEFSNCWVLLSNVYLLSKTFTRDSIDSLNRALKMESIKKEYVQGICYLLSKRVGEYTFFKNESRYFIEKAYNLSHNYLNCYELARQLLKEGSLKKAAIFFEEALKDLRNRNPLNPKEQLYYFNILKNLGYVYLNEKEKDYYHSISRLNDALAFKEALKSSIIVSDFYFQFYNDPTIMQKMQKLTFDNLNPREVFHYLYMAYHEIDMPKEANEYWELFRKC